MEPNDFLSRDEYDELSDDESVEYIERIQAAMSPVLEGGDEDRQLQFIHHFLEVAEWTLPPEDYQRLVRDPLWERSFVAAPDLVEPLEQLVRSEELTPAERRDAESYLERVRAMADHKRTLDEL